MTRPARGPGRAATSPLARLAPLGAALVLAGLVLTSSAARAQTVDCGNYLERFPRWSLEAEAMASYCGHVLYPPEPLAPPSPPLEPEVTATAAAPLPPSALSDDMLALQRTIEGMLPGEERGQFAIAVTDLQTGETISVNGRRAHFAACSINFFALLQATLDAQQARYPEDRVSDLIARTVYSSSAPDAKALYEVIGDGDLGLGLQRTRSLIASMRLEGVTLDHAPAYWDWYSAAGEDNLVTAAGLNAALERLWHTEVVNADWRDWLLWHMTEVKPGLNYLVAHGNGGVTSHKNGFFPAPDGTWVDNDMGIVRFERGGTTYAYALTMLSQYVPEKYADIPVLQPIAEVTWEHFSNRYP